MEHSPSLSLGPHRSRPGIGTASRIVNSRVVRTHGRAGGRFVEQQKICSRTFNHGIKKSDETGGLHCPKLAINSFEGDLRRGDNVAMGYWP